VVHKKHSREKALLGKETPAALLVAWTLLVVAQAEVVGQDQ
jgi:hypothetical protein